MSGGIPAAFFAVLDLEPRETLDQRRAEQIERWRGEGVTWARVTLVNDEFEHLHPGYPHGLWIEGWKVRPAKELPFGAGYPDENGPCYPPLTAKETHP